MDHNEQHRERNALTQAGAFVDSAEMMIDDPDEHEPAFRLYLHWLRRSDIIIGGALVATAFNAQHLARVACEQVHLPETVTALDDHRLN